MASHLSLSRRTIVKVGSRLLVNAETGTLNNDWLASLVADLSALKKEGKEVLLVSSGAVALGRSALGLKTSSLRLEESQAAAAVGQVHLAQAYVVAFQPHGLTAAQVLLTLEDSEDRRRYLNARETLRTLLAFDVVPVINENDTVATAEIRFGDNDRLAARVVSMVDADCLVLLSDVDGLYTANPQRDSSAQHVPDVLTITPEIEAMAKGPVSSVSRGGMESKIVAAKIATASGASVIICNGHSLHPLRALGLGAKRTHFAPSLSPVAARKRWIAGGLSSQGTLVIDAGAERALLSGKSLLPAGVTALDGEFDRGDLVIVKNLEGRELARGLIAYAVEEARLLIGRRTLEIEGILGYRGPDELIHRDDLALT